VTCNQQIKFHDLLSTAKDLDADMLATGHYIQQRPGAHGAELYRARDSARDQSYFLFATTRTQLQSLLFPLGALPKAEVRALARKYGLTVADKSDSQDICFVPHGRYASVVERLKPGAAEAGDILHVDGRRLGRHNGIINYTIGQRRGLGIPGPAPLYVVRLDAEKRLVIVGPRECLLTRRIRLRHVNWLGDEPIPPQGLRVAVRIRSSAPPQPATLVPTGEGADVLLQDGDYGIAAGQACVFYADATAEARLLGGGWISQAQSRAEQRELMDGEASALASM
jgi:tRNA-specific 2-thiouridylase